MPTWRTLVAFLVFGSAVFFPTNVRAKDDARKELENDVGLMIKLLEKKEYVAFVQRFYPPAKLEEMLKTKKIEDLAKEEIDYRRDRWIKEFKLYLDPTARVEIREDGKAASIYATDDKGKEQRLGFVRHGGAWYMK